MVSLSMEDDSVLGTASREQAVERGQNTVRGGHKVGI